MTAKITKWLMLAAAVLLIGYDIYVAANTPKGDTISEISLSWAWDWPTLPLVWGVVVGHLFWPITALQYKWTKIGILWGLVSVFLALDIWLLADVFPLVPLMLGVFAGHCLWPQKIAKG